MRGVQALPCLPAVQSRTNQPLRTAHCDLRTPVMPEYRYVISSVADGIGTITLNRPERLNAFEGVMAEELVRATRDIVGHPDVRAIVLTGSGRAFCAGADVGYMGEALQREDYDAAMGLVLSGGEVVRTLRQAPNRCWGASTDRPRAAGPTWRWPAICDWHQNTHP